MPGNIKILKYLTRKSKGFIKKIKLHIKHKLGWLGKPKLICFRGYGNTEELNLSGFLTEDKGLAKPTENTSIGENILAMLKRYASDEIPDVSIQIQAGEQTKFVKSNGNGIFECKIVNPQFKQSTRNKWISYHATVASDISENSLNTSCAGEILIPGEEVDYGIISDIDDTVLISHSTKILLKLRLMLFRNSLTRKAFPGIEKFFQELRKGTNGKGDNPFFYVSSSEWNLYDLLEDFFDHNNLPKGVFLLRELESSIFKFWKSGSGDHMHKYRKIKELFEMYPNMSFVLVGDNGQKDPYIYERIAQEYPQQIKAIYIRTIRKSKNEELNRIILNLKKNNIPLIPASKTDVAFEHAKKNGLVTA